MAAQVAQGSRWPAPQDCPSQELRFAGPKPHPTNLRAFLNSLIQPVYSPASCGRQEFWT